jgi:hypothetical protein
LIPHPSERALKERRGESGGIFCPNVPSCVAWSRQRGELVNNDVEPGRRYLNDQAAGPDRSEPIGVRFPRRFHDDTEGIAIRGMPAERLAQRSTQHETEICAGMVMAWQEEMPTNKLLYFSWREVEARRGPGRPCLPSSHQCQMDLHLPRFRGTFDMHDVVKPAASAALLQSLLDRDRVNVGRNRAVGVAEVDERPFPLSLQSHPCSSLSSMDPFWNKWIP